ncbi:hypothetical protein [uncultured Methanoregula sp.]|uniref:hypothetical protein n=1 Tax=uncultured Methanoregula sp. TaxID=1005933 RepID=UPI002AAB1340|nr:hypothetical protein [uncultured Methanoregula sp.]
MATEERLLPAGATTGQHPPFFYYIGLLILLICINALIAKVAVVSFNVVPGTSSFYIVVALMIVFALWFGMWGAIAAYGGCIIGAGLPGGIPLEVNLVWSLADFWQVLLPLIAFRCLIADPALANRRDLIIVLLFCVLLNNLCGALWGSLTLVLGGIIPWSGVVSTFFAWLLGNCVVCLILVPGILYIFTPIVRTHKLFVKAWWN